MRRIVLALLAVVALAGVVAHRAPVSGQADGEAAPIYGIKIPAGYRDWRLISVAHEEGNLNDLRAQLGNDVAIKAYREGQLPFPERPRIFSSWSRTQKNTLRRAAGGSRTLRTVNLLTRRCTKPASPAMSPPKLATLSSPVTHLNADS